MKNNFNKKILITSMLLTVLAAASAIIVGILINSSYILFAGLNTAVMIITSSAMIFTDGYIKKKDPVKFPFGKSSIAPFLVFVQYTLVTVMLGISLSEGIRIVATGGAQVEINYLIIYTSAALIFYNLIYRTLNHFAKKTDSIIVKAEVKTWSIDAYMNIAVMLGLLISLLLLHFNIMWITDYIDGIILIGMSAYLMINPIKEIVGNVGELLNMNTVSQENIKIIQDSVSFVQKKYDITKNYTRITKNGELIFVEIDFIVIVDWEFDSIEHQDEIRGIIDHMTKKIKNKWISISFTSQEKWAI